MRSSEPYERTLTRLICDFPMKSYSSVLLWALRRMDWLYEEVGYPKTVKELRRDLLDNGLSFRTIKWFYPLFIAFFLDDPEYTEQAQRLKELVDSLVTLGERKIDALLLKEFSELPEPLFTVSLYRMIILNPRIRRACWYRGRFVLAPSRGRGGII
ncbi:MAG: hypothetical protein NZ992_00065 [Candidatus Korarchaeum sp.]|nr:hypothetical protein [Candidatus Korarchaeum sp.]MDW8093361.1 hypothetical protein [Nitrososphaerota archaeon]